MKKLIIKHIIINQLILIYNTMSENKNKIRTIKDVSGIVIMYDLGLYSYKGLVSPQLFPPQLSHKYIEITNKAIEFFKKESNESPKINSYLEMEDYNLEKNNFIINFELYNEYIALKQPIKIQLVKTNKNIDDFLVEQNYDITELNKKIDILSAENFKYKEELNDIKNYLETLNTSVEKIKLTISQYNQPVNNQPVNNQQVNNQPINNQSFNYIPYNNQPINNKPINNQLVNNQPINNQITNFQVNKPLENSQNNFTFPNFNNTSNNKISNGSITNTTIPTFNNLPNNTSIPSFASLPNNTSIPSFASLSNKSDSIQKNDIAVFPQFITSTDNNKVADK